VTELQGVQEKMELEKNNSSSLKGKSITTYLK
jgi:hypothetical protein